MKLKPLYLIVFIALCLFACTDKQEVFEEDKIELEQHPFGYYDLYDSKGNLISKEHLFYPDTASFFGRTQGYDYKAHTFMFYDHNFVNYDSLIAVDKWDRYSNGNNHTYSRIPDTNGFKLILKQREISDSTLGLSFDTLYLRKNETLNDEQFLDGFSSYYVYTSLPRRADGKFRVSTDGTSSKYLRAGIEYELKQSEKIGRILVHQINKLSKSRYPKQNKFLLVACGGLFSSNHLIYNDTIFDLYGGGIYPSSGIRTTILSIMFSDTTRYSKIGANPISRGDYQRAMYQEIREVAKDYPTVSEEEEEF